MDPIFVVGAGPVGLTAAIELARRGVPVRVIDAGVGPSTTSKAIGIHARTLEVLQHVGVSRRLVELGLPLQSFRFHDQHRVIAELSFAEVPSAFPFALSLGQDVTERVLLDRLHETGVEVEWGARLVLLEQDPDAVRLVVQEDGGSREVRASWVVGCDGSRSSVRSLSGIAFEGEPFPEWFLVADLMIDSPVTAGNSRSRTNLFFSDHGATAVFPLPEPGLHRLATPLPRDAVPAEGSGSAPKPVDLSTLEHLWATRIGRPAELSDPRWVSPFQFHSRLAGGYRAGRLFLAGDAAHVHSPVGGQGMNTGIQDAVNLAWKLAAVLRGAPEPLLDTYETERRPVAAAVLHDTRRNAVLASATSPLARTGRALALRTVTRLGPVRRRFLSTLTMLAVSYPPSALPGYASHESPRSHRAPRPPGTRAPDGEVSMAAGGHVGLVELLAARGHVLLSFDAGDDGHDTGLGALLEGIRTGLDLVEDVHVVVVRRRRPDIAHTSVTPVTTEVLDITGAAHAAYGVAARPRAVLVRPDGTIAWRGPCRGSSQPSLRAVLAASMPPATTAGCSNDESAA